MLKVHDIYIYLVSVMRRCSNIFTVDVTYLLIKVTQKMAFYLLTFWDAVFINVCIFNPVATALLWRKTMAQNCHEHFLFHYVFCACLL